MERVWCYGIQAVCTASEFTGTLKVFFLQIRSSVGGVTSARRCHSSAVLLFLNILWNKNRLAELGEITFALTSLKLVIVNVR